MFILSLYCIILTAFTTFIYSLMKNLVIVKSPGMNVLTIEKIRVDQGGVYTCTATNLATDDVGNNIKRRRLTSVIVVCEYNTFEWRFCSGGENHE